MDNTSPATEPWQLTAVEAAAALRSRTLSSVELVQSALDRIEATNPRINALADVRPEEALAQARAADERTVTGGDLGPLHGIPTSTKINTDQRGYATSHGVVALAGTNAEQDAACVAALRSAGAVLVGRSNAPAFSYRWFSTNDLHGRTVNPWAPDRTPGGSSGGASASLAAGMTQLAQGNDIGGSIRYPAACCGVVGIRPTVGRVSNWTAPAFVDTPAGRQQLVMPLTVQQCAVEGPLARTVADARLALRVMSTPDLRDPIGVPALPERPAPAELPVVTVVRGIGTVPNHPAVERAVDEAVRKLADAGHRIEELDGLPLLAEAARLWSLLIYEDFRPTMPAVEQVGDADVRASLAYSFAAAAGQWGPAPSLGDYIHGWSRRAALITELQELLGRERLLLTPVSAEPPFEQDADIASPERAAQLVAAQWPMAAVPILGLPAATVPSALVDGLPMSVQLIGGRFEEELVLDAAQAIEDRTPRLRPGL
ncbi:amidase [Streptacidiphilus jiangxiensis]|uniref:Amidase n=1 Tax=Streptacidiphilus jiangxiensis TaxID=235985 RepID=A0A1H7HEZ7_STRJI|nr:amidase [Streptacidiphilus jiangxiensis]SEK48814.1 amidase [Streptacidiphilus jiangxiensis]